jgi:uncharacterized protein (TIGR02246 family)
MVRAAQMAWRPDLPQAGASFGGQSEGMSSEEAIRAVEARYDQAWRSGDLDGLVACLTLDAVLVNPRGDVAIGTEQIRRALGAFLAGEGANTEHHSMIERVSFVTEDVAIVDGRAAVSRGRDGAGVPAFEHAFTDVLRRAEGQWLIAHVRAHGLQERP